MSHDAPGTQNVECWLVLKAADGFGTYPQGTYKGQTRVGKIRVVKTTAGKPQTSPEEVAFKVVLDVHESWFRDGVATIKASIPAAPEDQSEIQATVEMPVKGRAPSAAASVVRHP